MRNRRSIYLFLAGVIVLACSCPLVTATGVTPPGAASPTQSRPPAPLDTATSSVPTDTPAPAATSTPTVPIAWPKEVSVNCRFGPGTAWAIVSGLNVGQTTEIAGRNADSSWWYVKDPSNPGAYCWVGASVTNTAGNLALLTIISPPNAVVTDVSVKLVPNTIHVGGCMGPIQPMSLKGTITVNGPASVKWHFETQQGGALPSHTTTFDAFGAKNANADYTPPLTAGSYWVRLIITSPNSMVGEAKYKITC
jgi:hypothetical protein